MTLDEAVTSDDVVAVVITYHPEMTQLSALMSKLAPQVKEIVIIDNGSSEPQEAWAGIAGPAVSILPQGGNTGVAAAQNAGIAAAGRLGGRFVIFFDQDSWPSEGHVTELLDS